MGVRRRGHIGHDGRIQTRAGCGREAQGRGRAARGTVAAGLGRRQEHQHRDRARVVELGARRVAVPGLARTPRGSRGGGRPAAHVRQPLPHGREREQGKAVPRSQGARLHGPGRPRGRVPPRERARCFVWLARFDKPGREGLDRGYHRAHGQRDRRVGLDGRLRRVPPVRLQAAQRRDAGGCAQQVSRGLGRAEPPSASPSGVGDGIRGFNRRRRRVLVEVRVDAHPQTREAHVARRPAGVVGRARRDEVRPARYAARGSIRPRDFSLGRGRIHGHARSAQDPRAAHAVDGIQRPVRRGVPHAPG